MAEVFPVDAKVIERTQKWLASQQQSDGSFVPDRNGIREGAINAVVDDKLRTTAYIALALKRTDRSGVHRRVVDHAREFAAGALRDPKVLEQVSEDPIRWRCLSICLGLLTFLLLPSVLRSVRSGKSCGRCANRMKTDARYILRRCTRRLPMAVGSQESSKPRRWLHRSFTAHPCLRRAAVRSPI